MKKDPNNWSNFKKVQWHLKHGDGFMIQGDQVVFQGKDYIGYTNYQLTKPIQKLLDREGVM